MDIKDLSQGSDRDTYGFGSLNCWIRVSVYAGSFRGCLAQRRGQRLTHLTRNQLMQRRCGFGVHASIIAKGL